MNDSKSIFLSKTAWTNVILAVIAFIGGGNDWVAAHPELIPSAFLILNLIMRAISKDKVFFW